MSRKRVVIISDPHCGHIAGLTPPKWWMSADTKPGRLQRETWKWFASRLENSKPDVLLVNGDAIDGDGRKSGGVEELTTDRNGQVEIALAAIGCIGARKIVMTAGTAYHTGAEEDFEESLARQIGAVSFSGQEFFEVEGVTFGAKHHCGSSSIPHGRHTAVAKEHLQNLLWSEHDRQPKVCNIIRSHVHYFAYAGGPDWFACTTPALQAAATRYGRRCSGTVDFGFLEFQCDKGECTWAAHILRPVAERARLLRL